MTTQRSEFFPTKEYRRFEEFCEACRRERYIGLCYGPPGVGKTLSARQYSKWGILEPAITRGAIAHGVPEGLLSAVKDCRTVFCTTTVTNTPKTIAKQLWRASLEFSHIVQKANAADDDDDALPLELPDFCELVIVDEADRLKTPTLEELRDRYDQKGFGLVFVGMPGLEKRLARYPQLYSRVGFAHEFRALGTAEMRFILKTYWAQFGRDLEQGDFTDAEAVEAIVRITGGNFRLLQRLMGQVQRILLVNGLKHITKEVVETARECLVIGTT